MAQQVFDLHIPEIIWERSKGSVSGCIRELIDAYLLVCLLARVDRDPVHSAVEYGERHDLALSGSRDDINEIAML